ncbi:hypothetical protein GCM10023187_08680 [Nibrella viscosa]|uniref:Uncharacterized protein n=1 Tax=Nibrella viscosa TaxID=1084524 RepID=A0ABP8JZB4_9BACT
MEVYSVEIIDPKAKELLQDMADKELIVLKPTSIPVKSKPLSEEELAQARARIMRGSPSLDVDEMVAHIRETRDRRLPFRDDE